MVDCNTLWSCVLCDPASLVYDSSLTTANTEWITENTYGCSTCNTDYHIEYALESTNTEYVRMCFADSEDPTEGTPCDLGLLYDGIEEQYACQIACNDVMEGCALCSSTTSCYACIDPLYDLTTLTATDGTSYSACVLNEISEFAASDYFAGSTADCSSVDANCQICSDLDTSLCQICARGYYVDSGACTAYSGTALAFSYEVTATSGTTFSTA